MDKFEREFSKLTAEGKRRVNHYRRQVDNLPWWVQVYLSIFHSEVWAVLQLLRKPKKGKR